MAVESHSLTLVEHSHANEMQRNLQRQLAELQRKDGSAIGDSLSHGILGLVVREKYDRAKEELLAYVEAKNAYPVYQDRVRRYVNHCSDLVQAIEAKRTFPGLATLSLSKQQEVHEKVLEHFEELKQNLKHMERIERDCRLVDVRSTVWVLKSLSWTVALVVIAGIYLDLRSGTMSAFVTVVAKGIDDLSSWIVNHLPFIS